MMGDRGPAPRREEERRRTNAPMRPVTKLTQKELDALPFEIDYTPEPAEPENDWHPLVVRFWEDLQRDPARKWMTSGDWAALAIFMEAMSRELSEHIITVTKDGEVIRDVEPPKGATLSAFMKMLEHVGVTESARLRIGKEVTLFKTRPADETPDADVVQMRKNRVQ